MFSKRRNSKTFVDRAEGETVDGKPRFTYTGKTTLGSLTTPYVLTKRNVRVLGPIALIVKDSNILSREIKFKLFISLYRCSSFFKSDAKLNFCRMYFLRYLEGTLPRLVQTRRSYLGFPGSFSVFSPDLRFFCFTFQFIFRFPLHVDGFETKN